MYLSLITRLKHQLRRSRGMYPPSSDPLYDYGCGVPTPEDYHEDFRGYDPVVGAPYTAHMPAPLLSVYPSAAPTDTPSERPERLTSWQLPSAPCSTKWT